LSKYGIDTNVLVRYLVQDDPKQSAIATNFLESGCTEEEPGFISLIVLCEIVWVLDRAYGYPRAQIASVLRGLLTAAELAIERSPIAWEALRSYEKGNADFADCVIGAINRNEGCVHTVTLDRKAANLTDFFLLT